MNNICTKGYKVFTISLPVLSFILFAIGNMVSNLNVILTSVIIFWVFNIVVSLRDMKSNINFVIFNITFFILLLGRYFTKMIFGEDYSTIFSYDIMRNTMLLLYISLISLYIGKVIFEKAIKNRKKSKPKKDAGESNTKLVYVRQISRIAFVITFILAFAIVLEKAIFVQQNSYIEVFKNFESKIPSIIQKLAQTNMIFLMIYLCSFPKRKETFIVVGIYGIYLATSILTGGRATAVTGVLILLIYFVYRQSHIESEKYFTKKTICVLCVLAIIGIVFLSSYNVWRNGKKIENFSIINQFKQFFIDQGGSVNIISYTQYYEDELPDTNTNYTFGPFITYFKYGTFARIFGDGQEYYKYNTKEMALYGNNLGATISFLVMPNRYVGGEGLGTQYIAEIYVNYSYFGVIIYNIIIGYLLVWFANIDKNNWVLLSFTLNILKQIIYLPRQSAMAWVVNLLSIPNILAIVIVYLYAEFMYKSLKGGKHFEKNIMDN